MSATATFTYANGITVEEAQALKTQIEQIKAKRILSELDKRDIAHLTGKLGTFTDRSGMTIEAMQETADASEAAFYAYEIDEVQHGENLQRLGFYGGPPHHLYLETREWNDAKQGVENLRQHGERILREAAE